MIIPFDAIPRLSKAVVAATALLSPWASNSLPELGSLRLPSACWTHSEPETTWSTPSLTMSVNSEHVLSHAAIESTRNELQAVRRVLEAIKSEPAFFGFCEEYLSQLDQILDFGAAEKGSERFAEFLQGLSHPLKAARVAVLSAAPSARAWTKLASAFTGEQWVKLPSRFIGPAWSPPVEDDGFDAIRPGALLRSLTS